ncbi:MAG: hypothetical protein ACE5EO_06760, partial [Candidatus Krumholzibacteriia bacterium]
MSRNLTSNSAGLCLAALALLLAARVTLAADLVHTVRLPRERVVVVPTAESSRVGVIVESAGALSRNVDRDRFDRLADAGLPALPYRVISFLLPQG